MTQDATMLWSELIADAVVQLRAAKIPDPDASAKWIGQKVSGAEGVEWVDQLSSSVTARHAAGFDRLLERRLGGEPIQYVLSQWSFRTLDLFIDQRVLIPRPETEVVAGLAIDEVRRVRSEWPGHPVVDLGTGSGAMGLSIAVEVPGTDVWLTDVSEEALQVARANIAGIGRAASSVRVSQGDWFEAVPVDLRGKLSVIASNPPYVDRAAPIESQVEEWEPALALFAEHDGLAAVEHILTSSAEWLVPSGAVVVEMSPEQVPAMAELASRNFGEVEVREDMAGRDRAIVARSPNALS